jgi:CheY-like chemotaxis protein
MAECRDGHWRIEFASIPANDNWIERRALVAQPAWRRGYGPHTRCTSSLAQTKLDQASMGREPYRIIVVEDHASTAEALRKFLTTIGYKVYIAPDIASARGLAKAIEFDVLLSDLRLPDGTGWDLMEELSAMKPVRAIAISGHNTDVDIERSRKVGFLDHIAKPLVAEELTAAIERAVTKPRPTGARH